MSADKDAAPKYDHRDRTKPRDVKFHEFLTALEFHITIYMRILKTDFESDGREMSGGAH